MTKQQDDLVRCARAQLDKEYKWGTHGPETFDCSGLTSYCYGQIGMDISPSSHVQFTLGKPVSINDLTPGDLIFYDTSGDGAGHVGMVTDVNKAVHALNEQLDIREIAIRDAHLGGDYIGARRLLDKTSTDPKGDDAGGAVSETIEFGKCKVPSYITDIIDKPWEGAGFDRVPPRNNVGMCMHKWWGYGDEHSISNLMSTGGERQSDAMVDWSCTQEGVLTMVNEPWKTRAGWANGPADDLEGDGTLFVRTLGISAVNSRLVSCEFEGKDEPLTDPQMNKGSSLWAFYFDSFKVPYTDYPLNPKYDIVTDLDHWEIGGKECPFKGARGQRVQFQDMVRGKMRAAQTGGSTDPLPPVNPPEPDHEWLPDGMTEAVVNGLFGTGTRIDVDGSKKPYSFDPTGVISNAWLGRGAKEKLYPEAGNWYRVRDATLNVTRNIVSFTNGWVLMGSDGARDSWKWL